LGEEEGGAVQCLAGLVENISLVPAWRNIGGKPVRSARTAGLSMGWCGSAPARYMAPVCPRFSRVKNGSVPALVSMLSPHRVASRPGENPTMAAGTETGAAGGEAGGDGEAAADGISAERNGRRVRPAVENGAVGA